MPILVYILLGIALLITLLLSSKIKLFICYDDTLTVYAKFLFLRFNIVADEKNLSLKPKRKKKNRKSKAPKTSDEPSKSSPAPKQAGKSTIAKLFELKEIILRFINKFFKKLHFKFIKLKIVIACENAAATALAYGAVTQGVSYILELLGSISTVEISKSSDISITTDFLSQKSEFESKIELYAHLLPILIVGCGSLFDYIKYKSKTEE